MSKRLKPLQVNENKLLSTEKGLFTYEVGYVNLMVTTKQKSRAETQNIKKKGGGCDLANRHGKPPHTNVDKNSKKGNGKTK